MTGAGGWYPRPRVPASTAGWAFVLPLIGRAGVLSQAALSALALAGGLPVSAV